MPDDDRDPGQPGLSVATRAMLETIKRHTRA
jgi:hypothetical protein